MLVLSRRFGQSIVVSGACRIEIVDIRRYQVKLGFEADGEVKIHRVELVEQDEELRRLHSQAAPTERAISHA